jgi:hypothetical protein
MKIVTGFLFAQLEYKTELDIDNKKFTKYSGIYHEYKS